MESVGDLANTSQNSGEISGEGVNGAIEQRNCNGVLLLSVTAERVDGVKQLAGGKRRDHVVGSKDGTFENGKSLEQLEVGDGAFDGGEERRALDRGKTVDVKESEISTTVAESAITGTTDTSKTTVGVEQAKDGATRAERTGAEAANVERKLADRKTVALDGIISETVEANKTSDRAEVDKAVNILEDVTLGNTANKTSDTVKVDGAKNVLGVNKAVNIAKNIALGNTTNETSDGLEVNEAFDVAEHIALSNAADEAGNAVKVDGAKNILGVNKAVNIAEHVALHGSAKSVNLLLAKNRKVSDRALEHSDLSKVKTGDVRVNETAGDGALGSSVKLSKGRVRKSDNVSNSTLKAEHALKVETSNGALDAIEKLALVEASLVDVAKHTGKGSHIAD